MKYIKGRRVVTSAPYKGYEDKWPQCDICGEKVVSAAYTVDYKKVCSSCMQDDVDAEFVDEEEQDEN